MEEEARGEGAQSPYLSKTFGNKNLEQSLFFCKKLFYIQRAVKNLLVYKIWGITSTFFSG